MPLLHIISQPAARAAASIPLSARRYEDRDRFDSCLSFPATVWGLAVDFYADA